MTKAEKLTGWFLLLAYGFTAGVLAMNGDWSLAIIVVFLQLAAWTECEV